MDARTRARLEQQRIERDRYDRTRQGKTLTFRWQKPQETPELADEQNSPIYRTPRLLTL